MLRVRDFPLVAAVAIAIYFAAFTGAGFGTQFAPDDFQNLWRYWDPGPWGTLRANLLLVTTFYRPLGGLYYLPLYYLFGFDPFPYRLVYHALIWLNVGLLYVLARRITARDMAAALAVLFGCFHAEAAGVYLSNSMIYEVLCYAFLVGCLVYYIRIRQGGDVLSVRQAAVFAVLFACALNAKEMAVVAPGILVVYELAFHGWRRPAWRELLPAAIAGAMSVAFTLGKIFGEGSLSRVDGYQPVYTLDQFLLTTRGYVGQLLLTEPVSTVEAGAFWGALLILAAILRRRAMWFGLAFAWMAFLPLNFVPLRQAFVLYIPLAGFAIYFGDLMTTVTDRAAGWLRWQDAAVSQGRALVFMGCLAALAVIHTPRAMARTGETVLAQRPHWKLLSEIVRVHPRVKPGAKLLLANSPLDAEWDLYFISKLYLNDHSVKVAWAKADGTGQFGDFRDAADVVWRFDGDKLVQKP